MKKYFAIAALVCIAALSVNAQTEENETKAQKFFRLTKTADDDPTDWKAQLEAGHFLLDKENGMYNMSQAEKYYERIYHLATDYNKAIPDTVISETGLTLMTTASDKKNIDKALYYADEMIHADKVGVELGDAALYSFATMAMMYSMMKENFPQSLSYMMLLREKAAKNNMSGIENTDITTAMLFEGVITKYKEMFGDKLIEVTIDGKKYIMIAKNDWNIEKPLMGWIQEGKNPSSLLYGEDGKIYDDIHGQMVYSFNFSKDAIEPQEGTNLRLITVTPERRQQLVEAYQKYIKKAN